jgi:small conductance mechanosensitive channel
MNSDLKVGESDLLHTFRPDTLIGALIYLILFVIVAILISRAMRTVVHAAMTRGGHLDRTTVSFLQQMGSALTWIVMLILYAHLIPELRALGTALLAGASIASVVIGLAAQSTLGNLVAGISITIYRPFRLGDTLQIAAPTGTEIGVVESISLGYTTLRTPDERLVVLPNSIAASQVMINLSSTFTPGQMSIAIRVNRDADLEAARQLAITVANETVGEKAVNGCYLTKMDATAAVLELRVRAPDMAHRDTLRSTLVARLAQRFNQFTLPSQSAERPSFA